MRRTLDRFAVAVVTAAVVSVAGPMVHGGASAAPKRCVAKKESHERHRPAKKHHATRPVATPAPAPAASPASEQLSGTFKLAPGSYSSTGAATGSYFRMVTPGGSPQSGPFFSNPDSTASDKTYTLVRPGTDSGLATGTYQPSPDPPFDANGNARANRIIQPQRFGGVDFSLTTNPQDPQTGTAVAAPAIRLDGGALAGDLRAISAEWNRQHFNQGSPKPGGGSPGRTTAVHGTYDPASKAFVVEWASQIVGGPFNGFTGVWHLEGTYVPRCPG